MMWAEDTDSVPSWFAWSSHHFDDCETLKDLSDRAAALKTIFDGAFYIAGGSTYPPFPLLELEARDTADLRGRRPAPTDGDIRVEPFSSSWARESYVYRAGPLSDAVAALIYFARTDAVAKAILKFTGVQGLSYITLYAWRDWMLDGKWDDKRIATEAGWSNARFKDFTSTANNPAYLGPFCRHGGVSELPSRPMPLEIAEAGMRKAMIAFLHERGSERRATHASHGIPY